VNVPLLKEVIGLQQRGSQSRDLTRGDAWQGLRRLLPIVECKEFVENIDEVAFAKGVDRELIGPRTTQEGRKI